jgi:dTDP-L-rhamnose 4-epimerase
MSKRILITGGAGFIGSHLADELLQRGYEVVALDCLSPQVHGENASHPDYLSREVELISGDLRDRDTVRRALNGVDAVYHLAARVGVGQSMYQIAGYTEANNEGTAILLEALIEHPVERLVVASSMSIYGEGLYEDVDGTIVAGHDRPIAQLKARDWDLRDRRGRPLTPIPTPETKAPNLASVYALSKYDQERMCLIVGRAYGLPTVALRFFNVYGPRQALSNPYTGVLAIFAAQLLNDEPPIVFEDGRQQRDFVNVADIARACRLALETPAAGGHAFNIGSGQQVTVREIAARISRVLGKENIEPVISGQYRAGDIRHCFADISLAQRVLGYQPQVNFDDGLAQLAEWLEGRVPVTPRAVEAQRELIARGLAV